MLDEEGVDFLAMRTVVVLIAAALLISAAAIFVKGYTDNMLRDSARGTASHIAAMARAEYISGCPGTGSRTAVPVTVPRCVRDIVFGRSPDDLPGDRDDHVYFIEFQDGMIETKRSEVPFAYGDPSSGNASDSGISFYPGEYSLELEVMSFNGSYAVAIYGGAEC